jgi:hypothetical protein
MAVYKMTEEEMNKIEGEVDKKLGELGRRLMHPPSLRMRRIHIDMIAEQVAQLEDKPTKGSVIIQMVTLFKRINPDFDELDFVQRCMNINEISKLKKS